ncbi:hypothetical protein [Nocardia mangyaensis]|uniref:hypothetical protein n=1 Tax=Nocardia mangyaensis TaxID=2213200 RepID=UPI0012EBC066|nr:hypothetical protein [Nocardia mangyaensis]
MHEPRGIPGGGENSWNWRHREIRAAFETLEVTDAYAQADKFALIARCWADGVAAFERAMGESLSEAWTGVGASAAAAAVDAHLAQARSLSVALDELPEVVRAAAEAIVATKYAIPAQVESEGEASTWAMRGAAKYRAAAAAEDYARAAMHERYVVPFGELDGRIPILPLPSPLVDSAAEVGDRGLLVAPAGRPGSETGVGARSSAGHAGDAGGSDVSTVGAGEMSARPGPSPGATEDPDPSVADASSPVPAEFGGTTGPDDGRTVASSTVVAGAPVPLPAAGGTGIVTTPQGPLGQVDATMSPSRSLSGSPYSGGERPTRTAQGASDSALTDGPRYQQPPRHTPFGPGSGRSLPGAAGPVIGAERPSGITVTRPADRFFSCAGPLSPLSPCEDTEHRLPDYLITEANTEALLGDPRPAIIGGVIGAGDDFVPGEQRSPAARR